ncbi:hypothetical protein BABINDRAFT_162051 [Babjeviella inositovora NRRL Y-12698]|uniref:RFX-type winged-helix domain-containing protein n=1 Tax=Babjeviella inositovora NRRL Y-12698 TaxID=984486 RepID=A0A1E3QMM3_9ASCO|nr:uncharacterized protein BABINDRAFT_162051 [Babjeviella inositovora NRRL Y-12698]ODQ78966.1 hypothetical protein BABINDRAFT_162051 [Babjeviella inositovora NRRL Y-12698]
MSNGNQDSPYQNAYGPYEPSQQENLPPGYNYDPEYFPVRPPGSSQFALPQIAPDGSVIQNLYYPDPNVAYVTTPQYGYPYLLPHQNSQILPQHLQPPFQIPPHQLQPSFQILPQLLESPLRPQEAPSYRAPVTPGRGHARKRSRTIRDAVPPPDFTPRHKSQNANASISTHLDRIRLEGARAMASPQRGTGPVVQNVYDVAAYQQHLVAGLAAAPSLTSDPSLVPSSSLAASPSPAIPGRRGHTRNASSVSFNLPSDMSDASYEVLLEAQQSKANMVSIPLLAETLGITATGIKLRQDEIHQKYAKNNKLINRNLKQLKENTDRYRLVFSIRCLLDTAYLPEETRVPGGHYFPLPLPLSQYETNNVYSDPGSTSASFSFPGTHETATPRSLIFKAYDLLCFQNEVKPLGVSAMGKLIKLIWPTISTKRLGVRGNSKYHYMGIQICDWVNELCDQYDDDNYEEEFMERKRNTDGNSFESTSSLARTSVGSLNAGTSYVSIDAAAPGELVYPAALHVNLEDRTDLHNLPNSPYLSFIRPDLPLNSIFSGQTEPVKLLTAIFRPLNPYSVFPRNHTAIQTHILAFRDRLLASTRADAMVECQNAIIALLTASMTYYEQRDEARVNLIDLCCYQDVLVYCSVLAYCQEEEPQPPVSPQRQTSASSQTLTKYPVSPSFDFLVLNYFKLFKAKLLEVFPKDNSFKKINRSRLTNAYKFSSCLSQLHKCHHLAVGVSDSFVTLPAVLTGMYRTWLRLILGTRLSQASDPVYSLFSTTDDVEFFLNRNEFLLLSLTYAPPESRDLFSKEGVVANIDYILRSLVPRFLRKLPDDDASSELPVGVGTLHIYSASRINIRSYTLKFAQFIDSLPALCGVEADDADRLKINSVLLIIQHLSDNVFQSVVGDEPLSLGNSTTPTPVDPPTDVPVTQWWQLKCWLEYFVKFIFEVHGLNEEIQELITPNPDA